MNGFIKSLKEVGKMKDNYSLHIAEMLVEQRKKSGKLQEDLARYCGVSKSAVSKWEKGGSLS